MVRTAPAGQPYFVCVWRGLIGLKKVRQISNGFAPKSASLYLWENELDPTQYLAALNFRSFLSPAAKSQTNIRCRAKRILLKREFVFAISGRSGNTKGLIVQYAPDHCSFSQTPGRRIACHNRQMTLSPRP